MDKSSMRLSFFLQKDFSDPKTLVLEKPESALNGLLTFVVFQDSTGIKIHVVRCQNKPAKTAFFTFRS